MTKHEKIARQLAAELSDKGERAWQSYVALAREVDDRLEREFRLIIGPRSIGTYRNRVGIEPK